MIESKAQQMRPKKQARSQKTEQALLDALETLLSEKSFSDLTVSELASEAGLTTGAIYRRFKDKEDLLRAAFERFYERSEDQTLTSDTNYPASMSDRSVLETYFSALMHFTLEHIHLMRAANHLNDAHSFELMVKARITSADWLSGRLQNSQYGQAELQTRCRFMLRVATATFRDTFISGRGANPDYMSENEQELDKLSSTIADMAYGYLGVS